MHQYYEYQELLDEYTEDELFLAYRALTNVLLQEELYETESILLTFLIDTDKQEQLCLWYEDQEEKEKEYEKERRC
jgi:hypothetical protein